MQVITLNVETRRVTGIRLPFFIKRDWRACGDMMLHFDVRIRDRLQAITPEYEP